MNFLVRAKSYFSPGVLCSAKEVIDYWREHDPNFLDSDKDNMHLKTIRQHKTWTVQSIPVSKLKLRFGHNVTDKENRDAMAKNKLVNKLPPIIAVPDEEAGFYLVLDGEHRTSAAKKSGLKTIKAFIPKT